MHFSTVLTTALLLVAPIYAAPGPAPHAEPVPAALGRRLESSASEPAKRDVTVCDDPNYVSKRSFLFTRARP